MTDAVTDAVTNAVTDAITSASFAPDPATATGVGHRDVASSTAVASHVR
jgi:hypothetical protein